MRTSDPQVLAIGDCTNFHKTTSGRRVRLESVPNANDQARAAATILGTTEPFRAMPSFWSEQGWMRLQMAGLSRPTASDLSALPPRRPASRCCTTQAGGSRASSPSLRSRTTWRRASFSN